MILKIRSMKTNHGNLLENLHSDSACVIYRSLGTKAILTLIGPLVVSYLTMASAKLTIDLANFDLYQ